MIRAIGFFVLFLSLISQQASAQCVSGDCKNGKGTYVYPSGAKYTGSFKNGEIHGIGICYYSNGAKYQGEWRNRYPDGKGTKTYSDGTVRTGYWRKGKPVDNTGKIVEEYVVVVKETEKQQEKPVEDDGTNIQSGCISGDCKNGTGVFAYPDGSKYEGTFKNGKYDGSGTWYFGNGNKYVGNFKDNFPNGKGTLHRADGVKQTGEWRNGEYFGSSLIESGKIGCVEGDCKNGEGVFIYKEGSAKYTGKFSFGQPEGFGVCVFSNGDRYRGNWATGAFDGKGTLYLNDGTEINGYWAAGEYAGKEAPKAKTETPVVETPADKARIEQASRTKVYAVVAGVAAYNHMPVLRYTDDDAYRFYAFLKSIEGGALADDQITILVDDDATLENITSSLRAATEKAGENDLVIFYFSGHGLNGSFLPFDFDGFNNKLLHTEVASIFDKCRAKYKLCLADACHSGSILAMRSGEVESTLETYYKTLSKSVSGTALLMSSKSDETSLESAGLRQGVFSHFLIRGLKGESDKDNNGIISIEELYDFIYENVRAYTGNRQSPLIKGTYDPRMPVAIIRK